MCQELNNVMKVEVYRVGDFSKRSEPLGQMSGRSTGFFGTGYYFCTKPEKCAAQGGGHRPLYKMTFDDEKVKVLRGTLKRHNALKLITRYIYAYPLCNKQDLEKLSTFAYFVEDFFTESSTIADYLQDSYQAWGDGMTWLEYVDYDYDIKHRIIGKAKDIACLKPFYDELLKDSPDFDFVDEFQKAHADYFDYNYIRTMKSLKSDAAFQALLNFNLSESEFEKIASDLYEVYKDFYDGDFLNNFKSGANEVDSVSTTFMRFLGYDGIWPDEDCDNISYGGILYDLDSFEYEKLADDVSEYLKANQ